MILDRSAFRRFAIELSVLVPASVLVWIAFAHGVHPLLGWPSQAPIPARSAVLVALLWLLTRRSGESWREFGLARPRRIWWAFVLAFVFLVSKIAIVQPLADWITSSLELAEADRSVFDHLHGNPAALVLWLMVAWLIGGFAEELLFRGYLMRRFADLFHGGFTGWTVAVLGQSVLFGLGHFYLGPAGMISAAVSAVFLGLFFLMSGRNLWPVILLHGTWDTLGLVLIYLSGTPSTG